MLLSRVFGRAACHDSTTRSFVTAEYDVKQSTPWTRMTFTRTPQHETTLGPCVHSGSADVQYCTSPAKYREVVDRIVRGLEFHICVFCVGLLPSRCGISHAVVYNINLRELSKGEVVEKWLWHFDFAAFEVPALTMVCIVVFKTFLLGRQWTDFLFQTKPTSCFIALILYSTRRFS
jgi:hypothetical protein